MDINGPNTDTNYNVNFYYSKRPKPSGVFVMCKTCCQDKKQYYLNNYERIFKETYEEGLKFIKKPEMGCCAGKKDQNGQVLKQENCPHC